MMTIDEAIKHCEEKSCGNNACALEHKQLAEWLNELKELRLMDNIQKIREKIVRLKSNLMYGACSSQIAMETRCKEEAYNEVLAILDAMQEEPVSEDLEKASKEWLRPQLDNSYADYGEAKMMELTHFDGYAMLDAIEFGAKWKDAERKNR